MPVDEQVEQQIEKLEAERERLRGGRAATTRPWRPTASAWRRSASISIAVGLPAASAARRATRLDPGGAHERSAETVEKYWQ